MGLQPRAVRAEPQPNGRMSLVPWWQSRTILLVEDDKSTRRLLAAALRLDGHRVVEISNGDDALDWLGPGVVDGDLERVPDLVVSDVHLPHLTGLEILELLQGCTRRIPVILITGLPDAETHAQAKRLGARCLLEKPFHLGDLRAAVQSVLRVNPPGPRDAS
jgi:DNA-binding response OmpR family regulator